MLEQYRLGFIQYLFVKWQTRSLGIKIDKMIFLLPVCICIAGEKNLEKCIQNTRKILNRHIKSRRLAFQVFRRVMHNARRYFNDSELFEQNRQKLYDLLTQHIQLFSLVLDIYEDIPIEVERMSQIVRKNYDEAFKLPEESARLLMYQERRLFTDQNPLE
ncbi:hypothetical protein CQA62_06465 [Helicobacter cholecystus]|uniref:Uncharacterized protein n=1 Tax=Helicobacter cholecystus TaxID=45498 RepID=A0A3D8IUA9_9HELI|nr:hypothetical protein [Helicobacter cholecystus]RDU68151.1 hypothetical protein CQA62_06465 [Helicobacter cholecystus]VEJ24519.1 Uncharacterised protein [Helicobacter cholecystus]